MSGDVCVILAGLPGCARLGPSALAHLVEAARTQEFQPGAVLVADRAARQPPLGVSGRSVVERSGAHECRLDLTPHGDFP